MEKKKYYISVGTGEISQLKTNTSNTFEIEANDEEIRLLREIFDEKYSADWLTFVRAHVPYVQYHVDKENDMYDEGLVKAYSLLHQLGTAETKAHIESMGILDNMSLGQEEG